MQLRSIKAKMILWIAVLILVSVSILGSASYWNAKKMITQEIETTLIKMNEGTADKIGDWLEGHKSYVAFLANSPTVAGGDAAKFMPYLGSELKRLPIYKQLLVIEQNGDATYTNGDKKNLADRGYFKALMSGKTVVSNPVISKTDNIAVVVAASPITRDGAISGGMAGTIDVGVLNKLMADVKVGQTGYAFVIQDDGLIIFHPKQELVMKLNLLTDTSIDPSLKNVAAKMVKGEQGLARYTFKGEEKFLAYRQIPGTSWSLAINVPVHEVTSKLNTLKWTSGLITLLVLALSVIPAIFIATGITRPLNTMKNMLQDIAQGEGDLTKRLDDTSKDEIGDVSRNFNQFVDKLQRIISQIAGTTDQVAAASVQLHATAEEMSSGTAEASAQATTVATAGEEMSATSGDIAQNCSMAAGGARQASEAAVAGARVVDETIAVMNSIAKRVMDTAKSVENLGNRSEQIGEIVGTIEDIADQTNLLALNAAIEAARAGEQGRGFAVVADEVRALAERTTRATKEISEMIKSIQTETHSAVLAMEEGVTEVGIGSEKATDSGKALENILDQINDVTMQINQVATAAEEQTATTSEISNSMHQITNVIAQASHGAHESAAAADRLSGLAEELRRIVGQFKL